MGQICSMGNAPDSIIRMAVASSVAQVGAADVEFLVVADDAPVDAHLGTEHPVLDVGAEFAQQVQSLEDC